VLSKAVWLQTQPSLSSLLSGVLHHELVSHIRNEPAEPVSRRSTIAWPGEGNGKETVRFGVDRAAPSVGRAAVYLERIALFDVNTGHRSAELCGLKWSWEIQVPELDSSVFLLPEELTKNGEERIVLRSDIRAKAVLE